MLIGTEALPLAILPKFGLLMDILLICEETLPVYVYNVANTICYQQKYGAYEIEPSDSYLCCSYSSLKVHRVYNAVNRGTSLYLKPRTDLSVFCNY